MNLTEDGHYFAIQAPPRSGKTTIAKHLEAMINEEGHHYALYCDLEGLLGVSDESEAMHRIVDRLFEALSASKLETLRNLASVISKEKVIEDNFGYDMDLVTETLRLACKSLNKDLVVLFDETDSLSDVPFFMFLHQLKFGHEEKYQIPFPLCAVLIGERFQRDHKIGDGTSFEYLRMTRPLRFIREILTLSDFTKAEVNDLYARHIDATGQIFHDEAVERAFYWSAGQPWLINALASEAVENILNNDVDSPVTAEIMDIAARNIIM
ncbi:MAG: hypothetical protein LBF41_05635, partial [Deltaproteobacteria bacterium]|nr:hypothetical protein [Deltaproteobacteria bacterium]